MIEVDVARRPQPDAAAEIEVRPEPRTLAPDEPSINYLVLGDFGGRVTGPLPVQLDQFDETLSRMDVHVGTLQFHRLNDFHPDRLCQRVPLFGDFKHTAVEAAEGKPFEPPSPDIPKPMLAELLRSSSLLEQITEGIDPFQRYLRELAHAYASPQQSGGTAREEALGERLRSVLHHPHFQAIESAWRGVHYLLRSAASNHSGPARIFVAQYSRDDANRDLLGSETGAAQTGRGIQEILNAGRWRAIAGLYRFGPDASDIDLLRRLASLAAEVRAPLVSSCALTEGAADMGPYWNELTALPEADHLGLALPRFLLRLPYGPHTAPIESFAFEEMPGAPVHSSYLWGNPSLACLALLARGGSALDLTGLPLCTYQKDGEWITTPPAEMRITEVQELALIEAGLMPLVPAENEGARLAGFRAVSGTELPLA